MLHRSHSDLGPSNLGKHNETTEKTAKHTIEHWKKLEAEVDHLISDIEVTNLHTNTQRKPFYS